MLLSGAGPALTPFANTLGRPLPANERGFRWVELSWEAIVDETASNFEEFQDCPSLSIAGQ